MIFAAIFTLALLFEQMIKMKKITAFFIGLLIVHLCFGQTTEVSSIDKDFIFITHTADYYQATAPITFDSAKTKTVQENFVQYPDKKILFRGYDPFFYWSRFSIKNTDSNARNFILLLGALGIRKAEIWQSINREKYHSLGNTGYSYPFGVRKYPYVHYGIPITIPPASTLTFYLNIDDSHTYKVGTFLLVKAEKMFKYEHRFYLTMGILAGVLLLFALTNLYMYFTIKEKIHLWYCLYNLSILFFAIKNEGLDAEFLGLDSVVGYRSTSMAVVAALSICLLLHVVQLFLTNISRSSIFFKLNNALKCVTLTGALVGWIVFYMQPSNEIESVVFRCMTISNLLAVCLILITAIFSLYKGFRPALFILSGLGIFLIGSVSRTLFLEIDSFVFPPSLFEIGLVFEAVIISFGIQHRYNLFKMEKEKLAKQLSEQQINLGRQILETQENERKRIAEDLHDELGSSLAALKMRLQKSSLPDDEMKELLNVVDKASEDTRNISHHLMPPEFEKTTLFTLLSNYYSRLNAESNIQFDFLTSGNNNQFSKEDELVIYRIIMELTSNILKHSQASEATIQMIWYEKSLEIMIEDNGKGINKNDMGGIGLRNIQSRVNYLDGEMRIDSNANGITIIIQIPIKII